MRSRAGWRYRGNMILHELDRVRLRVSVTEGGCLFPAGTCGTVVHVYPAGDAAEVEIQAPAYAMITVLADWCEPVAAQDSRRES